MTVREKTTCWCPVSQSEDQVLSVAHTPRLEKQ